MKTKTKAQRIKDLSKKNSERAMRGWRVRRLRAEADPRPETYEEIVERHKRDRKGSHYATWQRKGLRLELHHSRNRSDQYDVTEIRGNKWGPNCEPTVTRHYQLPLPKVLKLFSQ